MYTCGPTVYHFAHIGNLRTYIFADLLRRVLEYGGYRVNQAMNITDVGHLVGETDFSEDKMEVGAKREGKHPLEIAKYYQNKFFEDCKQLNILYPHHVLPATQAIFEQIEIIQILVEKGFAYQDEFAIYFDTSKLPDYGKLTGQKLSEKMIGAREDVVIDKGKRNPADFALWFFLKGRYEHHTLHWPSPWGEGFPGWHIECSAISRKLLGQPFDIHTGGVDHISPHHTNEIAQSEAAFGTPLANVWMHGEFLLINSGRMGKSEGNLMILDELKSKGFDPLDYRYLCLTAHYRTQLNFTWENLEAARTARYRLNGEIMKGVIANETSKKYEDLFLESIENDLNIPQALSVLWTLVKDENIDSNIKTSTILKFDKVLGLNLEFGQSLFEHEIPEEVEKLEVERARAREEKNFIKSDELRKQIENLGYEVLDTAEGQKVRKKIQI